MGHEITLAEYWKQRLYSFDYYDANDLSQNWQ
jgi:hypothetical protein